MFKFIYLSNLQARFNNTNVNIIINVTIKWNEKLNELIVKCREWFVYVCLITKCTIKSIWDSSLKPKDKETVKYNKKLIKVNYN